MNLARIALEVAEQLHRRMKTPLYTKTNFSETTLQMVSLSAEAQPLDAPAAEGSPHETDTVLLQTVSANHSAVQGVQHVCDIGFCALALLLLWPVFALIALLIRADSPGPVLFKQSRVGKDGQEFWFYKFRSMVSDAEALRHLLEMQNERSGPVFKMKNDPRITRVGRVLRKFSLDELPQLINVLKGDMSLVGPRPALPKETEKYTARQRQRLLCLPGVTGLWQVSGRASLSFERSIELDLYYIERQSVGLYFRILLMTIPAVLRAEGAY